MSEHPLQECTRIQAEHEVRLSSVENRFNKHDLDSIPVRDTVKKNEYNIVGLQADTESLMESVKRHKEENNSNFIKVEDAIKDLVKTTEQFMTWMKEQKNGKKWWHYAVGGLCFGVVQSIITTIIIKYFLG